MSVSLPPMVRSLAVAAVVCIETCPGPPWVLRQSDAGIVLRWYADDMPAAAAAALAATHCGAIGRVAELAGEEEDGSAALAAYRCR